MENLKAHCPTCDGERVCFVHGHHEQKWNWTDGYHQVDGLSDHHILECRGCETVFYQCGKSNSEDWDVRTHPFTGEEEHYYPVTFETFPSVEKKPKKWPDWLMQQNRVEPRLSAILREMYTARDSESYILASVGLRTAFDRASELLGISPEDTFVSKITSLRDQGYIGQSEADALGVVADAGSAAAHRGWSPSEQEFDALLLALEHFLERNLVSGNKALAVKASIPPKPPKAAKAAQLPQAPQPAKDVD